MSETTTIQVTTDQRDELMARKTYDDEPIKSVIARLLAEESGGASDGVPSAVLELKEATDEDLDEIKRTLKELQRNIPERTAEELEGRMR
jgi:hypothetical protein